MLYLLLSILCSTLLVVLLRGFSIWKIESTHAIIYNYIFCVITGLFFVKDFSVFAQLPSWNGFPIVIALGFGFILTFILTGKTAVMSGIVTTSIATKLSFVIPVVIALFLYNDSFTLYKIIGVLSAIVAVYLIAYEKQGAHTTSNKSFVIIYPFLIFMGNGLCDATFNYIQKKRMPIGWDHPVIITIFAVAMLVGWLLNFYKKEMYQWKNIAAGILLGIPNYFSLYFLLKTLNTLTWQSSVIFPINNLGIVCLSAFTGFVLFKEKFNARKLIGFILAIASIVIIGFLK